MGYVSPADAADIRPIRVLDAAGSQDERKMMSFTLWAPEVGLPSPASLARYAARSSSLTAAECDSGEPGSNP